jgi:hypothetical protein
MTQTRIGGLGKGDVVAVRVGDHCGLEPVARGPLAGVDIQLVQLRDLLLNAGGNQSEGAGTGALGELINLQRSASLEAPFSNPGHSPGWRALEKFSYHLAGGWRVRSL